MSAAARTQNRLSEQSTAVTHYKVSKPEIPGDYAGAGGVPPLPPGTRREDFTGTVSTGTFWWWVSLGVAVTGFLVASGLKPKNHIKK